MSDAREPSAATRSRSERGFVPLLTALFAPRRQSPIWDHLVRTARRRGLRDGYVLTTFGAAWLLGLFGLDPFPALVLCVFLFVPFTGVPVTLLHDLDQRRSAHDLLLAPVGSREYASAFLRLFAIGVLCTAIAYGLYWFQSAWSHPRFAGIYWGRGSVIGPRAQMLLLIHLAVLAVFWVLFWGAILRGAYLVVGLLLLLTFLLFTVPELRRDPRILLGAIDAALMAYGALCWIVCGLTFRERAVRILYGR